MGDWIPGISQLKSGFQLICGDIEGAFETQANFLRQCPIVSQVTSGVQLLAGDTYGAIETQKQCLGTISRVADGVPAVGHVKGLVHYAVGDDEGGNQAMRSATRTTAVLAAGTVGLAVGPVGAVVAGVEAGALMDIAYTYGTNKPQGYVAAIKNVIKNPNAGGIFDAAVMPVGDAMTGMAGYNMAKSIHAQLQVQKAASLRAESETIMQRADANARAGSINSQEYIQQGELAMKYATQAEKIESSLQAAAKEGGKTHVVQQQNQISEAAKLNSQADAIMQTVRENPSSMTQIELLQQKNLAMDLYHQAKVIEAQLSMERGAGIPTGKVAADSPTQAAAQGTCSQSASTNQPQSSSSSKSYSVPAKESTRGQLVSDDSSDDDEEKRRRMNKFKSYCERNMVNRFIRARNPRARRPVSLEYNRDLSEIITVEEANRMVVEHMVQYAETISNIPVVAMDFIVYQLQSLWVLAEFEFLCRAQGVVQVDVEFWSIPERSSEIQWGYIFQINLDNTHSDAEGRQKPAHVGYEIHSKINNSRYKKDDVGHAYLNENRIPLGRPQLNYTLRKHESGTMKYKLSDGRFVYMKYTYDTR